MALFAVSYDLKQPEKDYEKLWAALEALDAHRTLNSVFLVNFQPDNQRTLLNHLKSYVDENDRLMVFRLKEEPDFTKALSGTNDWISKNT